MTAQEALTAAREFLARVYPKAPPTIVLRPDWVREHDWAWEVVFDSQEHLDSGDFAQALFTRVVVVPKNGHRVDFMPTVFDVEMQQYYLATGRRTRFEAEH
ncbi:YrhB family protein [Kitasatospora sp. NBC_01287]|uniref:YrhB domain-containing protein n=1 Tax=Kitasatospora sp. NBC_01287 TaxID=2903573 RepID=UPI002251234E|nr:YrhB domain-containing protein [Kitasatospora sp. NBC_01287]MCX4747433.1 YrhB family protein [Kitasatospora sp. NBC_01287]